MADSIGMTFPIPLPVILKDEKEFVEEEAWKQYQEKSLQLQEAALQQQIKYNEKGNIFALNQLNLLGDIADKPEIKNTKKKQVKFWDKIFKNKIFEKTLKGIKGIASSLGGGLFDTLIGLMMWAFIDPDGSLMISLINIFVNLSVMVIRMFAKMIPMILKLILKVLPVIIKAINEIISTIIDVLPEIIDAIIVLMPLIFNTLAKAIPQIIVQLMNAVVKVMSKLKDSFPFLEPILSFIEKFAIILRDLFDPKAQGGIEKRLLKFTEGIMLLVGNALWSIFSWLGGMLIDLLIDLKNQFIEDLMSIPSDISNAIKNALGVSDYSFITDWFEKSWNWFIDNALDLITTGIRILILPFTWPVEAGLLIYKNWEKIKKKISEGMKAFEKMFPDFSKTIRNIFDGLTNINVKDVSEMIFRAFDTALLGIPGLLRRAFGNIPGAEFVRESFEKFNKWFQDSWLYKNVLSKMIDNDSKQKPSNKNFGNVLSGIESYGSSEVDKAKELFNQSGVDAETLKQVIISGDVKKLNLSQDKEQELVKAIKDLKSSVGGEEKFKEIQKQIRESKDDKSLSDAIYKLATQKPFQNVIGSVSNSTVSKSGGR